MGLNKTSIRRVLILALGVLLLAGCRQTLYQNMTERNANDMMGALLKRGVYAVKTDQGKGLFSVSVDESQVVSSLEILRRQSLPPNDFSTLGSVFPKEGMMSSPLEEEARLSFAIAQELAGTCAELDGVLSARAHVVMQEQDQVTGAVTPASASIFIRYLPGSSVEQYVPHIRNLAANAVPDLKYDKTYVFLFPASDTIIMPPPPKYRQILGVDMAPYAVRTFMVTVAALICTGMGLGLGGLFLFRVYRERKAAKAGDEEADA